MNKRYDRIDSLKVLGLGVTALAMPRITPGLVVPVFGMRPVLIMIVSQVLAALATPVIVLAMMILQNKKGVMGEHKPGMTFNVLVGAILLFAIFMAVTDIIGIKGLL